ncbi:conserved protein of unknown function [Modestobacter italicus]|uniref:Uncharacterized protein n=1 Tax=Modestobacter italicus (strain DSM 44449 / CECT 9708 / BC 501) TaxID=2732864 RepID=I4F0N7_MODI5|nr:hypothetical protein [Modestobacter marinus]CCH89200.1 conserved protein of unknown function [Modestobacter marinus]
MAERPRRYLRPGLFSLIHERLWVVDEEQPVAVVLDVETGVALTTVAWPELPPPAQESWPSGWQVRPAIEGLWVHRSGGPLLLVDETGVHSGHLSNGRTLGAVSAHGAWCLPDRPAQDIAATEDAPPRGRDGLHQLFVVHPQRTTATVLVDAPVHAARSQDGDMYLQVETGRWTRRNLGTLDSWDLIPDTAWLRLPAADPLPDRLSLSTHRSEPPRTAHHRPDDGSGRRTGSLWLPQLSHGQDPPDPWATEPEPNGGINWYAGWVGRGRNRTVAVVAIDSDTSTERFRLDLGRGTARAVTATPGWLWLALEQPRPHATYSTPAPIALIRVRADDGAVKAVLPANSVDVSEHCWSLPAPPVDAADYTAFWKRRFANLDHYWIHADGRVTPLTDGLSGSRVDVVGAWPDTALHITFDYAARPGRRLRRIVPLFDELGRPTSPEYAEIHLMETLDTKDLPDGSAPSDSDCLDV